MIKTGGARVFSQSDIDRMMRALEYVEPSYASAYDALRIALGVDARSTPSNRVIIDAGDGNDATFQNWR